MLSTLFLAPVSASDKFAVSASVYTSSDGECGGDRVLHVALEADLCLISPEICQFVPSCESLSSMIPPELPIKLGECFSIAQIMSLFPEDGSSDDQTGLRRLRATSPEEELAGKVQDFLVDVVAPMARRRQTIPDLSGIGMDSLPFGDVLIKCGGSSIGAMSAGASAGITAAVFLLIFGIVAAVMFYGYKVKGFRVTKPEEEGNQGVEMNAQSTTPKRSSQQWQTDAETPKGEIERV